MAEVDLRHLRYLVAVADEGGFSRAAERLSMTQPALSRAVQALERAVGADLLIRVHRGVELTAAGKELVERSRLITEQVDSALTETRRIGLGAPALRVSARGCELGDLGRLTDGFNAAHPGDRAEPVVAVRAVQADEVRAGITDVALISGGFDDSRLDTELLDAKPRIALIAGSHPLAGRTTATRAELAADPVIVWATGDPVERAYWLGTEGWSGPAVAGPEVDDMFSLAGLVRAGRGVAFVPGSLEAAAVAMPGLRALHVPDLAPERTHLAWSAGRTSPAVARFVRHVTDVFAAV